MKLLIIINRHLFTIYLSLSVLLVFTNILESVEQNSKSQNLKKNEIALNLKHNHPLIKGISENRTNSKSEHQTKEKKITLKDKTEKTSKKGDLGSQKQNLTKKEKNSTIDKNNDSKVSNKDKKPETNKIITSTIPPKEEVTILSNSIEEISFIETDFSLIIRANEFRQGNLGFVKINETSKNKLDLNKLSAKWNGKSLNLHKHSSGFLAALPISPEIPAGINYLSIEKSEEEKTIIYKFPINILLTNFPERKMYNPLRVPKKYVIKEFSPETQEFIRRCEEKKQSVFSADSDLKLTGNFVLPLDKIFVTSPFYVKRLYHPSKPPKPHGGVDLRGKPGVSIYAIQDGKVVISERMFYEGIFTVIDHGSKIFSLYMHQSRTHVKEGDLVKAGDLIGEVGSTGISTGPHLHLGLKVDGEIINPLSVLQLTLFK